MIGTAGLAAEILFSIYVAVDAWRQAGQSQGRPRLPWYSTALVLGLAAAGLNAVIWGALPRQWKSYAAASSSMSPALNEGDWFFADRSIPPVSGDVIIVASPDGTRHHVKRLIAKGGDRVQLKAGTVYVNGESLALTEFGHTTIDVLGSSEPMALFRETLKSGRSYVIARAENLQPLHQDTAEIVVPEGDIFVLGDNRDNSMDSRFPEFGALRQSDIVDVARVIYWSRDRARLFRIIE